MLLLFLLLLYLLCSLVSFVWVLVLVFLLLLLLLLLVLPFMCSSYLIPLELFLFPLCILYWVKTSSSTISFNPANASSCTPSTRSFMSEVMLLQTTVNGWTWCVMNSEGTGHGKRMSSKPRHDEASRRTWLSVSVASFSATGRQICAMCIPFITLAYDCSGNKDRLSSFYL